MPNKKSRQYDEIYFLNYSNYSDISLYEVGMQRCIPSYSYGPIIRKHYIIHFVLSGHGTLYLNNKPFAVHGQQAFLVPPGAVSIVQADDKDPWYYIWILINGSKAIELLFDTGFSLEQPVYTNLSKIPEIETLLNAFLKNAENELFCIGNLYHLFDKLITSSVNKPALMDGSLKYINTIVNYISVKYSEPIKVQDLADVCGLERCYMTKLFKSATGFSPQEYLISFRMKRARKLLSDSKLPIQHIAYSVGYKDQFSFSKAFRKFNGISPSVYREESVPYGKPLSDIKST